MAIMLIRVVISIAMLVKVVLGVMINLMQKELELIKIIISREIKESES